MQEMISEIQEFENLSTEILGEENDN